MPLRDHFHPPLSLRRSWDELHGQWPAMIVLDLNRRLPPRYVAAPRIHLGAAMEVDVASFDEGPTAGETEGELGRGAGGLATAVWAPPRPTFTVAADLPDDDEYEVRIHDEEDGRRLVAAVEIVSPSNKDRPESRRAFVAKCAELLRRGVSVAIVDLVTARQPNLYGALLDWIGQSDPAFAAEPGPIYAAACRWSRRGDARRFETWAHPLSVGGSLPTLPLWLAEGVAVPLDLEASYEETCRVLRIA